MTGRLFDTNVINYGNKKMEKGPRPVLKKAVVEKILNKQFMLFFTFF